MFLALTLPRSPRRNRITNNLTNLLHHHHDVPLTKLFVLVGHRFLLCSTNNPLLCFVDSSEILHNLANSLGLLRLIWRPKAFCCCYGFLYRFLTFQWWPNSWKIKSYFYSGEFQSYKSYVLMHDFSSPRSVENKTETKRNIIAEQIQFIKINGVNSIWPNWLNLAFDSFRWNYKRKNRNLLTLKKNL